MPDIILETFPNSRAEGLAYAYVRSIDLSQKTPEEILDIYEEAFDRIQVHYRNKYRDKRVGWTSKSDEPVRYNPHYT